MGHSILLDICDQNFFFLHLWGLFTAQAKQLHRTEEIQSPSAWWVLPTVSGGLPTPALAVVLLMQHRLGGLIISIEVNYISHYSKSPVHAMLSTSFNSLPPVTVDFCIELLLYIPHPFLERSSMLALCLLLLLFPSVFLVAVAKCFGGSRWEQPGPCSAPGEGVGRAVLCPAWHRVLTLRGQAVNPTLCALCWS